MSASSLLRSSCCSPCCWRYALAASEVEAMLERV
eukprot:CAMPEP_0114169454 /NCGR_PEP_ID=MMETSP0043_2-20121206/33570_1 /TAXON_ID=464988 /ORGANISM="Hemiselmis andersenii, Strain CCMP644" /LENGTH=33 /DNA_ID= /DNA_START= /DNA_END= /DNA_ORIENTATION=